MVNGKVFPKLEQAVEEVGEAGCRLAEMNACEEHLDEFKKYLGKDEFTSLRKRLNNGIQKWHKKLTNK